MNVKTEILEVDENMFLFYFLIGKHFYTFMQWILIIFNSLPMFWQDTLNSEGFEALLLC